MNNMVPNARAVLRHEHLPDVGAHFILSGLPTGKGRFAVEGLDLHTRYSVTPFDVMKAKFLAHLKLQQLRGCHKHLVLMSVDTRTERMVYHATALCADHETRSFLFHDSKGDPMHEYMRECLEEGFPDYEIKERQIRQQYDSMSCTFYAAANLRSMARGEDIVADIDIMDVRRQIQTMLKNVWWPRHVEKKNSAHQKKLADILFGESNLIITSIDSKLGIIFCERRDMRTILERINLSRNPLHIDHMPVEGSDALFVPADSEEAHLQMT